MKAIKDVSITKEPILEGGTAEEQFFRKKVSIEEVLAQLDEIYYGAVYSGKYQLAPPSAVASGQIDLESFYQEGMKRARDELESYLRDRYGK